MKDLLPVSPISGVKNCHAEGVYSFMISEDQRVFATTEWTPLAANDFGDAVGFHDHHRDIGLRVVLGEILNITARPGKHPYPYKPWTWDSTLRNGSGRFTPIERDLTGPSNQSTVTLLNRSTGYLDLNRYELHTVKQLSKMTAWIVSEYGESTGQPTTTWSRMNLSNWHTLSEWYQPMTKAEINQVWGAIRSAIKP